MNSIPHHHNWTRSGAVDTHTIVIGGGQAGLAVSRCLTDRGHEHVVLERGRIGERWRSERWDSMRLLTPNWMTRLPGHVYRGDAPGEFMTAGDFATLLDRYAVSFAAPISSRTTVQRATRDERGFVVSTDRGALRSHNLVIATGWCDRPAVPACARALAGRVHQVVPNEYRSPAQLPDGGVLVVGASATGVQLADEIHRSGRPVTLAVGSHSRMPRRYRGMDAFWWLDQIRAFDRTVDEVRDVFAARNEPSLQLVGRPDHATLDLVTLQALGVRLAGRLGEVAGETVHFHDDLAVTVDCADRSMVRLLGRIDDAIHRMGLESEVWAADPVESARTSDAPRVLDLRAEGISTIVWATGHVRRYDWLDLPVFDGHGEIAQRRGVTPVPGAYVLGQRFQHRRDSNFIDGVGRDAEFVAEHICTPSFRAGFEPAPNR